MIATWDRVVKFRSQLLISSEISFLSHIGLSVLTVLLTITYFFLISN